MWSDLCAISSQFSQPITTSERRPGAGLLPVLSQVPRVPISQSPGLFFGVIWDHIVPEIEVFSQWWLTSSSTENSLGDQGNVESMAPNTIYMAVVWVRAVEACEPSCPHSNHGIVHVLLVTLCSSVHFKCCLPQPLWREITFSKFMITSFGRTWANYNYSIFMFSD